LFGEAGDMIVSAARTTDARLIDLEPHYDERGFFARTWCRRELANHGIETEIAQESTSYSHRRGTLRGLHFQTPPHDEAKIVRCIRGAIFNVIADLRPQSPTYLQWEGFHLDAENRRAVYVPRGFAHGFQALAGNTEVYYQISNFHAPGAADGVRYDDPAFGIRWPLPISVISQRDLAWPDFHRDGVVAPAW